MPGILTSFQANVKYYLTSGLSGRMVLFIEIDLTPEQGRMTKRKIDKTLAILLQRFDNSRDRLLLSLESENRDLLAQLRRQIHTRGDDGIGTRIERNRRLIAALT